MCKVTYFKISEQNYHPNVTEEMLFLVSHQVVNVFSFACASSSQRHNIHLSIETFFFLSLMMTKPLPRPLIVVKHHKSKKSSKRLSAIGDKASCSFLHKFSL